MMKNLKMNEGALNRLMGYSDQQSYSIHNNVKIFADTKNSKATESHHYGS